MTSDAAGLQTQSLMQCLGRNMRATCPDASDRTQPDQCRCKPTPAEPPLARNTRPERMPTSRLATEDRARFYLEQLNQQLCPGRLLDIGPQTALFSRAFRNAGWSIESFESHDQMDESGLQQPATHLADIVHQVSSAPRAYDLISLRYSLQKHPIPENAIRQLALKIPQDAYILVENHNVRSLSARWRGKHWEENRLAGQRHHFTPEGMDLLMNRQGLARVRWGKPLNRIPLLQLYEHLGDTSNRVTINRVACDIARLLPQSLMLRYRSLGRFWALYQKA